MSASRWVAVLYVDKVEQGQMSHYSYRLTTSSAQADAPMALRVEASLRPQIVEAMCRSLQAGAERAPDHGSRLRRDGEILYRLLFGQSREARELAARLSAWRDPLVISTNDVQMPWELVHDGTEFLGIRLALGRQIVTSEVFQEGRPIGPVGETRRALIVSNPTDDLDAANDESTGLARFLKSHGIECTVLGRDRAEFVSVIDGLTHGTYDIFHYSGHVGMDESGNPGLRLKDQYLSVREIRAACAALGDGPTAAPPVVFLNGCQSAEHLSSVCGAFLDTGSRIVMGTRYRIIDLAAREFAECWYTGLLAGLSAGRALQQARDSQRHGVSGTWAAFVLFGQPATQLWEPPLTEPGPALPPGSQLPGDDPADERGSADSEAGPALLRKGPWAAHARCLDGTARQLLLKVIDSARGFNAVTSFHLAVGLISAPSALAAAVDAAEIDPRWLSEMVALNPDLAVTEDDGSPGPSDNVRRVLNRAASLAHADSRDRVTIDDLAAAFADTGGGEAGKLLSSLGVDLGRSGSFFSDSGVFRSQFLTPETHRALSSALLVATVKGEVISSHSMLVGFALASSQALREALLDQGRPGAAAVRTLFPEASRPTLPQFSRRAALSFERALEIAQDTEGGPVSDALVLREILADPDSAACAMLTGLGVDPVKVRASLTGPRGQAQPSNGAEAS